jgi:signal transduction histidine kinase
MRRILLILGLVLSLVFLAGGVYILGAHWYVVRSLDRLAELHRVQSLRDRLYADVQSVHSALKSRETRFSSSPELLIQSVRRLSEATTGCLDCHHSALSQAKLAALQDYGRYYQRAVSRVLTMRANERRLQAEEDLAILLGDELVLLVSQLTSATSAHLEVANQQAQRLTHRGIKVLVVLVALGPAVVVLATVLLLRSFGRPLTVLLEGTRALKAGDLTYRVHGLKHEFKELGEAFNEMVAALGDQMRHIQRAEQLAASGELAAHLAHEIKNPLASIRLSLQTLAVEVEFDEEQQRILGKVQQESARIEKLMRDLLDYTRPKQPKFVEFRLAEVLERAEFFGVQHARAKRGDAAPITLTVELEPELPALTGDPDQLLQVLINIVLNAIDAMPKGGEISIRGRLCDGSVQIELADQGPGVPPELRAKVFEPFYTRKRDGTGLGLATSKRLVEQLGGSLALSEAPGGGALFVVRLPVSKREV